MTQNTVRRTDRSLPIALLRARETIMVPVRDMLSQSGISEQKWRVLRVVDESGPLPLKRVAHLACLLAPSVTRIIQALEEDGLLLRRTDATDKRKSTVCITARGRRLILSHSSRSQEIFERLESQFGTDRLNQLLDLLEDLQRLEL